MKTPRHAILIAVRGFFRSTALPATWKDGEDPESESGIGVSEERSYMNWLGKVAMIFGTFLALTANAQESRPPVSRPQGSSSAVILKVRTEAAKMATARFSRLFSALYEQKIRGELILSAKQVDGLIWETLTSAQARVLSRIMGGEMQQTPGPAAKRKRAAPPS